MHLSIGRITNNESACTKERDDSSKFSEIQFTWTTGLKLGDESIEETNSMDDDLVSLLNNFPSSMPLPEWYNKSTRLSNESSSSYMSTTDSNMVLDSTTPQNLSPALAATVDLDWAVFGSCCWKNMPGIC